MAAIVKLLGLTGFAGSGKDSVAALLARQHGFARMSFAEPIKLGLATMLRLPLSVFEDRDAKERPLESIGCSPRRLMQTLGTEWGRQMVRQDLWICVADELLRQHRRLGSSVVLTDVRFDNEAQWIRAQGGEVWHVARPLPENAHVLPHASELGVVIHAGADSILHNDRGLEQLADEVTAALAGERRIQQSAA